MFARKQQIEIKSGDQLQVMRQAGLVVARTLQLVSQAAAPGVTTSELNEVAHETLRNEGATPSFLGYHGFPAVICTSVSAQSRAAR